MRALLFPGQGAQRLGVLPDLTELPEAFPLLRYAQQAFGGDLLAAVQEEKPSQVAVQTYLYMLGVASFAALRSRHLVFDAVAGLSIGTFSAAVACGAVDFEELLPVVVQRGRLMEARSRKGSGLVMLEGLSEAVVSRFLEQFSSSTEERPSIAIVHPGRRIVVAGRLHELERLTAEACAAGPVRVRTIDVPCASHSPQMVPVAEALAEELQLLAFRPPRCPYFSNSRTRLVTDEASLREDLAWNVARPVRWSDGLDLLAELGVREYIEALPGDSLQRMARTDCREWLTWAEFASRGGRADK